MKKIILFASISLLSAASFATSGDDTKYPQSASRDRWNKMGSVLGDDGGIDLLGGKKKSSDSWLFGGSDKKGKSIMTVNPFLWQASLDVVSFMPIRNSDPVGGVISTDWHEDPEYPGERYIINIVIKSSELNINNIKVTVFKQKLENNVWRAVKASKEIAQDLEEKILTKARQLNIESKRK